MEFSALAMLRPFAARRNAYFTGGATLSWMEDQWAYLPKKSREILGLNKARIRRGPGFNRLEKLLWLADAGAGYMFSLGGDKNLFAEGRFQYNLSDIIDNDPASLRFYSIVIGFGYQQVF
jgi:hypothetical protein